MADYQGYVIVFVNVASRCGFANQYHWLKQLYLRHRHEKLIIIACPCNQFANQEPLDNAALNTYLHHTYQLPFPVTQKLKVTLPKPHKLYAWLQAHCKHKTLLPFIPWNFCKVLVDREGHVIKRYLPWSLKKKFEQDLQKKLKSQ